MEDYNGNLIRLADQARSLSYAPYSGYTVGAALATEDGEIFLGANVENASYGATVCAERTAIYQAIIAGKRRFKKIAVVGGRAGEAAATLFCPCGICRQVMAEFCADDFEIITASKDERLTATLGEALPSGFGKDAMRK